MPMKIKLLHFIFKCNNSKIKIYKKNQHIHCILVCTRNSITKKMNQKKCIKGIIFNIIK